MWTTRRSGDKHAIAAVSRHVVWADFLFTTPAVIIQPLTGITMTCMAGYDPFAPWLVVAYALYLLTGACWLPVVWIQMQTRDLAALAVANNRALPARHYRLMRLWFWLGWPAFGAVLAIFWLMVAKPALW